MSPLHHEKISASLSVIGNDEIRKASADPCSEQRRFPQGFPANSQLRLVTAPIKILQDHRCRDKYFPVFRISRISFFRRSRV